MKRVSLVLMGLAAVLAVLLPASTASAATVVLEITSVYTEGCSVGDNQAIIGNLGWSDGSTGYVKILWRVWANDELIIDSLSENTAMPSNGSSPFSFGWVIGSDLATGALIRIDLELTVDSDVAAQTVFYTCGNDQFWRPTTAAITAGPDMVPLPDYAVVGQFTQSTVALFAPRAAAGSNTVIEKGNTLWVLGMDESGQFYKVVLSGQYLWVPVGTIGPNFDDVWQGKPLPTTVVQ